MGREASSQDLFACPDDRVEISGTTDKANIAEELSTGFL